VGIDHEEGNDRGVGIDHEEGNDCAVGNDPWEGIGPAEVSDRGVGIGHDKVENGRANEAILSGRAVSDLVGVNDVEASRNDRADLLLLLVLLVGSRAGTYTSPQTGTFPCRRICTACVRQVSPVLPGL